MTVYNKAIYENKVYRVVIGHVGELDRDGYIVVHKEHGVQEQAFTELYQALAYADHLEYMLEGNRWREPVQRMREEGSGLKLPQH